MAEVCTVGTERVTETHTAQIRRSPGLYNRERDVRSRNSTG